MSDIDPELIFEANLGRRVRDLTGECAGAHFVGAEARVLIDAWECARHEIESPIELILLAELIFLNDRIGPLLIVTDNADVVIPELGTVLECQKQLGQYRADFAVTCKSPRGSQCLIIECDGHDFHERTKEQAQRDKSRDRHMVMAGYKVLRFTGSEIYRNSRAVFLEVQNFVAVAHRELALK